MPIKIALLVATLMLSALTPASSCALGFSFQFAPLPSTHFSNQQGSVATAFLNAKLGLGQWRYNTGDLKFRTLKPIENSNQIPLSFGSKSDAFAGKISQIHLYQIALNPLVKFTGSPQAHQRQVEKILSSADNSHAKSGTVKLAARFFLNTTNQQAQPLPHVTIRLRATKNAQWFQALAIFFPTAKDAKPIVAVSDTRKVASCTRHVFVEGDWPEALRGSYRFE